MSTQSCMPSNHDFPYYLLKIYVDSQDPVILEKYREVVTARQKLIHEVCHSHHTLHFDAGFDIFVPQEPGAIIEGTFSMTVNHKIHCSMDYVLAPPSRPVDEWTRPPQRSFPTAYYLHPRSSLGTKTPWRLANSAGIIDSGYRGALIGAFDRQPPNPFCQSLNPPPQPLQTPKPYMRLLQICGPDLKYPIFPMLVDSLDELGQTNRGAGGFGSTGV
jgi:hypothetical protein